MKTTLKHLGIYLINTSLECQCIDKGEKRTGTLIGLYTDGAGVFGDIVESDQGFDSITPLLRDFNFNEVRDIYEAHHHTDPDLEFLTEEFLANHSIDSIEELCETNPAYMPYGTVSVLAKYKFDIHSLIPAGLAIKIE